MVAPLLAPTLSPAVSAPTRLRVPDLLQATDRCADDVLSGRYDRLLAGARLPTDERWYNRLYGDDELDIWLISWVPDKSTELHDHGGSLGALTVVSGALQETRWDGHGLRSRKLRAGDQAGFPLGWVHDVVWAAPAGWGHLPLAGESVATVGSALPTPAPVTLSVHAYSPPLTAMSYYGVTERNALRRSRTELTDAPEG
ncbi:cysteine dioxygenase [Mycobacterium sp. ITM-2016-00316]|uniref:cysteine dioxygenase n=1 Tax=Mycobacterium sp. ITM-2016-00316 TaxID=2099695 RepID=UPI000CF8AFCA|nr:cysteine dioxygenase [Mycobacterium sp. ITM-2016-00316]WNG80880.1 cysteine dioxygenase [Mycobacterium sp. ITM-2016-00316]